MDFNDLNEYQDLARQSSLLNTKPKQRQYGLLNMAGEIGEITSKHAKSLRDNTELDKEDLQKELGDLLWSMSCYADGMGFSLAEVASKNIEKLKDRRERGVLTGSGDER